MWQPTTWRGSLQQKQLSNIGFIRLQNMFPPQSKQAYTEECNRENWNIVLMLVQ